MSDSPLLLRLLVQTAFWLALMGGLLFLPARTLHWPQAWVFLTIFAAGAAFMGAFLIRRDPELLAARLNSRLEQGQPLWDRVFMLATVAVWCAWLALMALDAKRLHPSQVPGALQVVGALLIITGFAAVMPVFAANSFAAPVVRVQNERKQRVIDTGPYAFVRHPMYAAALLYLIGMPLLLGSWYGLIGSALLAAGIATRTIFEESELKENLPGYTEYMTRVRWRLIPGVW